jgi:hypothetical protein
MTKLRVQLFVDNFDSCETASIRILRCARSGSSGCFRAELSRGR